MKKGFIILIIFILVCIAGGSFLAIHLIRNIEVNETSIVKEPLNHEGIENFTSVNLDLTSMDVKIEKSSENAISYRLQDVKKQKLDYSVDDGVLTVKEIILDKHFVGHDDNEVIIYTTNDSLIVNGNLVEAVIEALLIFSTLTSPEVVSNVLSPANCPSNSISPLVVTKVQLFKYDKWRY